jgi:hypothetical protein
VCISKTPPSYVVADLTVKIGSIGIIMVGTDNEEVSMCECVSV